MPILRDSDNEIEKILQQVHQNGIWFATDPEGQKITDFGLEPEKAKAKIDSIIQSSYRSVPEVRRIVEYTKQHPDETVDF
jgi:hypothetical protein